MSDVILKVEKVSKQYRLGTIGTGTISHDLNRFFAKIRGKEDPFLTIGEVNDRDSKGDSKYVWALRDINFEVKRGEVLGIIGKNGAGKSTLLKILSKVTGPTQGNIKAKGKIASLLEVGTGFHPEMTGRENIFLNGAILGMTKKDIRSKLDEIISFSGCERYIDTPVKRYSSGMRVRLAFAVAAHLEPDILVVDEVLAVGDLEFQKRAVGKMKDISGTDGRTVLFVSHNMAAVKLLCTRAMVLDKGEISYIGDVDNALIRYKDLSIFKSNAASIDQFSNDMISLKKISAKPTKGEIITIDSGVDFEIDFECHVEGINLDCTFELVNSDDIIIYHRGAFILNNNDSKKGLYSLKASMPKNLLNSGMYAVNLIFGKDQKHLLMGAKNVLEIDISEIGSTTSIRRPGIIYQDFDWSINCKEL